MRRATLKTAPAAVMFSLCLGSMANAVVITSGVTTIFNSGGFENDAVGSVPSAVTPSTGVPATSAEWEFTGNRAEVLAGATVGGPAGAYSGVKYATVERASPGSATFLNASFSQYQSVATDSFSISTMVWLGTSNGGTSTGTNRQAVFLIMPDSSASESPAVTGSGGASSTNKYVSNVLAGFALRFKADETPELARYAYSGNQSSPGIGTTSIPTTTANWTPGIWNAINYTWDASQAKSFLSVNGTVVDITMSAPVYVAAPTVVGQFQSRANTSGPLFLDAVPEPATLAAAAVAAATLLGRRRRTA